MNTRPNEENNTIRIQNKNKGETREEEEEEEDDEDDGDEEEKKEKNEQKNNSNNDSRGEYKAQSHKKCIKVE